MGLLFEPMHGVTIACWATASVEIVASVTPPAFTATGQAFLNLLRGTLGSSVGTTVSGYLISNYGENTCYRTSATIVMIGLIVYAFAWIRSRGTSFQPVEESEVSSPAPPPDQVGRSG